MPARSLARFVDIRFARYLAASVGALAVDAGTFLALMAAGMAATPAAALGYTLGIAVHWLLSSRAVFADSLAAPGLARTRQQTLFILSALIGLVLTTAIVAGGAALGSDPRLAKLFAIGASFVAVWLLRRHVVFAAPAAGGVTP